MAHPDDHELDDVKSLAAELAQIDVDLRPEDYGPEITDISGDLFLAQTSVGKGHMALEWRAVSIFYHRGPITTLAEALCALRLEMDMIIEEKAGGWLVIYYIMYGRQYIAGVLLTDPSQAKSVPAALQQDYGIRVRLRWAV